ncbi:MAG: ABC transporter ATP-binding protein, partial [Oscillospiraceae bacterium]
AGRIVERGTIEEIYANPRHPYTIGLFGSIPDLDDDKERLTPIQGLMPDPSNLPKGCAFAPRCPHCTDACLACQPQETKLSDTHFIRCILEEKGGIQ